MLGCGVCKYSTGDKTWRNLTAMSYHYETQPLPNAASWYIHHFPMWFHKFAAVATHVVEGPVAFLCFGNEWMRIFAFLNFTALTLMINSTGNYGFLGILTTVQTFPLIDDSFYHWIAPSRFPEPKELDAPWPTVLAAWIVALPYLTTSLVPLWSTFRGQIPWKEEFLDYMTHTRFNTINKMVTKVNQMIDDVYERLIYSTFLENTFFRFYSWIEWLEELASPFSIINRYAKFGSMSTYRWELIFQGSNDLEEWKEYDFKYKPGDVHKTPPVILGHLPGLDWRLWFLGPGIRRGGILTLPSWYYSFLDALLEGRKEVLDLLSYNPYPHLPPKYVRCVLYDYKFTKPGEKVEEKEGEKNERKAWWKRERVGVCGKPRTLPQDNDEIAE